VRGIDQELLPDEFLGLPEVRRLAREGGAMHSREVREEVGVVTPEVGEELCIFVHPQELTDDLDGEDFGVVERGAGPRALRRPRSAMRSSIRQKTAMMKVLRSKRA
jgi:hypothetical protein